jgi:hypothetical protein
MRNALILSSLALAVGLSSPASADYRNYHHHGNYGNYGHRDNYRGNYNGGGDWVAPLVGGLIFGGVLGSLANQPRYYNNAPVIVEQYPPQEVCRNMVTRYDRYGRPVVQLVCGYDEE